MVNQRLLEKWSVAIPPEVEEHAQNLWEFLSDQDSLPYPTGNELIFVHGNWYDRGKAKKVARLAKTYPEARIIIAGGIGRLSSQKSEKLGAEAFEMRELLEAERVPLVVYQRGSPVTRVIFYTGARQTGDNVDFALYWRDLIYGNKRPKIIGIDESYLVRRVRATTWGRMKGKGENPEGVVSIVSSPTSSFPELVNIHDNRPLIPLYFMVAEIDRLNAYSTEGNQPYLFPHNYAYPGVEKFGGENAVAQSAELLRGVHDFEEARRIMGDPGYGVAGSREMMLRLFSPTFS